MEDTLKKLIEIEQLASSIMESSEEEIKNLDEAMSKRLKSFDELLAKSYDEELIKIDGELKEAYLSKINNIKALAYTEIKELNNHYESRHEQYVDELFNSFIED